ADCVPSGVGEYQFCQSLEVTIPQGTRSGDHVIDATSFSGCTASGNVRLAPKPQITALEPSSFCVGRARSVQVRGGGFESPIVFVDGATAFFAAPCSLGATDSCLHTQSLSGLSQGLHQIAVENRSIPPTR